MVYVSKDSTKLYGCFAFIVVNEAW